MEDLAQVMNSIEKKNIISLGNKEIKGWTPWKETCEHVRKWNPTSGNFDGGLSSSDFARSNWCPSEMVKPEAISLNVKELNADSTFRFIIQGATKTIENNLNFWLVSAYLVYR